MTRLLLLASLILACEQVAPTEVEDIRHLKALRAAGVKKAKKTGVAAWECSDSDSAFFSITFIGEDRDGEPIEGAVCCAAFKLCTVRF